MRIWYFLVWIWIMMTACSGPAHHYILSEPGGSVARHRHVPVQIGVDRVTLPAYLSGNGIPRQGTDGTLEYCEAAMWAASPDKGLQDHTIAYLQKSFSTPNVYRYPWDIENKNGVRLHIALTRFLYDARLHAVVLDASYYVETLLGTRRRARLYSIQIPVVKGETSLIVSAMNQAFDRLLADIARTISHF